MLFITSYSAYSSSGQVGESFIPILIEAESPKDALDKLFAYLTEKWRGVGLVGWEKNGSRVKVSTEGGMSSGTNRYYDVVDTNDESKITRL